MYYYAFVIVLSPDWLIFCHMIISVIQIHSIFYLFFVSLTKGLYARNVRFSYPYWQYTNLFISFDLYLYIYIQCPCSTLCLYSNKTVRLLFLLLSLKRRRLLLSWHNIRPFLTLNILMAISCNCLL